MSKRKKAKVKRQEHCVSRISQIFLRVNGLRRDIGIVVIVSTLSVLFLLFLIHRERSFQEEKVEEEPQSISEVKEEDSEKNEWEFEEFMDTYFMGVVSNVVVRICCEIFAGLEEAIAKKCFEGCVVGVSISVSARW